jgi:hypothetical protein
MTQPRALLRRGTSATMLSFIPNSPIGLHTIGWDFPSWPTLYVNRYCMVRYGMVWYGTVLTRWRSKVPTLKWRFEFWSPFPRRIFKFSLCTSPKFWLTLNKWRVLSLWEYGSRRIRLRGQDLGIGHCSAEVLHAGVPRSAVLNGKKNPVPRTNVGKRSVRAGNFFDR